MLLLAAGLCAAQTVSQEVISTAIDFVDAQPRASKVHPKAKYAPGQIIVMFKENAANASKFNPKRTAKGIAQVGLESLDGILTKAEAKNIRMCQKPMRKQELFRKYGLDRWCVIEVPVDTDIESLVESMEADPNVESAMPNWVFRFCSLPDDPYIPQIAISVDAQRWGHKNTGDIPYLDNGQWGTTSTAVIPGFDADMETAWEASQGYGSSGVVIADLNSGVQMTVNYWNGSYTLHPDLEGRLWTNAGEIGTDNWGFRKEFNGVDDDGNGFIDDAFGRDCVELDGVPQDSTSSIWHGTMSAGIIVANAGNQVGVTGIASGCKLMEVKVNSQDAATVIDGIGYAIINEADVITMAMAGMPYNYIVDCVLQAAWNADILMFAATGNGNLDEIEFPASSQYVYAVGAAVGDGQRKSPSTADGSTTWGSNYGSTAKDSALSVDILGATCMVTTCGPDYGYYGIFKGTSCAAPYVAGVAALIKSQHPTWTRSQIWERMKATATDVVADTSGGTGLTGWDRYSGYGLVNAGAALFEGVLTNRIFDSSNYIVTRRSETVVAGPNCTIASGGNVILVADESITLQAGFTAESGCTLTAQLSN